MNFVRVYVQDQPVPLLYVGPTQVNFLISTTASPGAARIRVVTEGIAGPEITVTLVAAAPALFASPVSPGYVIAQDKAGNLLTPDSPAHAGDTVVIYVTGLGRTSPNPGTGEMPIGAAQMLAIASLNVTLNGIPVPPDLIKYAGVTPYSAGLYQINLYIPERTGDDPELGVTAGAQSAQSGLKLPVR
jgi:uncharacterized protein (TIGR03437 family)